VKKTAQNAVIFGARLLTFETLFVNYFYFLNLIERHDAIMYKMDVIKLDRQDDGAAYRTFCSVNLRQCLTEDYNIQPGMEGLFIYLFVMEKYFTSVLLSIILSLFL
jgi:hypothetical protein